MWQMSPSTLLCPQFLGGVLKHKIHFWEDLPWPTRKAFVSRYKVVHEYVHYSHVVRGSMSHVTNVSQHIVVPTIFGWSPVTQNPFLGGFTLTTTKNSSTHKTLEQLHLRADLSSSRREFDSSDDTTYVAGEFTMNANCLFSSKRFRDNENISIL